MSGNSNPRMAAPLLEPVCLADAALSDAAAEPVLDETGNPVLDEKGTPVQAG